jgi:hypothetical protein
MWMYRVLNKLRDLSALCEVRMWMHGDTESLLISEFFSLQSFDILLPTVEATQNAAASFVRECEGTRLWALRLYRWCVQVCWGRLHRPQVIEPSLRVFISRCIMSLSHDTNGVFP